MEMLTLKQLRDWGACREALVRLCDTVNHINGSVATLPPHKNTLRVIADDAYWPLREVLDAARKAGKLDYIAWLRDRDPRVAEIEAEGGGDGFDAIDWCVKDVVVFSEGAEIVFVSSTGGPGVALHGECEFEVLLVCQKVLVLGLHDAGDCKVLPTWLASMQRNDDHITRVTRAGVQIYPEPAPKFKVGSRRDSTVLTTGFTITDYNPTKPCQYTMTWEDGSESWWSEKDIEKHSTPAPEPEPSIEEEIRVIITGSVYNADAAKALMRRFDITRKVRK